MAITPLTRLFRVFEELRKLDPEMPMQTAEVLLLVAREPGVSGGVLRERAGVSKSAISRILDKLSDRDGKSLGLVKYLENPEDLRFKTATLTAKGERVINSINHILEA